MQNFAPQAQPKDALNARALHPSRGARVPCPAAAPDVAWICIDIGGNHVRLHLVALHVRPGPGVIYGVEEREQPRRLVALAESRKGHHRPHSGVRILASVLPNAWRITLDVARIEP